MLPRHYRAYKGKTHQHTTEGIKQKLTNQNEREFHNSFDENPNHFHYSIQNFQLQINTICTVQVSTTNTQDSCRM